MASTSLTTWLDAISSVKSEAAGSSEAAASQFDAATAISTGLEQTGCTLAEMRDAVGERVQLHTQTLVAAIHEHYDAFVALSSQTDGFHSALNKLRTPLVEAEERVQTLLDAVREHYAAQHATAQRSAELRHIHSATSSYIQLHDAVTRMDGMVSAMTEADSHASISLPQPLQLYTLCSHISHSRSMAAAALASLDGVASTIPLHAAALGKLTNSFVSIQRRIQSHVDTLTTGGASPLRAVIRASIAAVIQSTAPLSIDAAPMDAVAIGSSDDAYSALLNSIHEALRPREPAADVIDWSAAFAGEVHEAIQPVAVTLPALSHAACNAIVQLRVCAFAAAELSCAALLHACIRDMIITPFLNSSFTQGVLDGGVRGSFRAMPRVLDAFTRAVTSIPTPDARTGTNCIIAVMAACHRVPDCDVLTECVWAPLVSHLLTATQALTQSQAFHSNFTCIHAFYTRLCVHASTLHVADDVTACARIRSHAQTHALATHTHTRMAVYSSLCDKDLRARVDKACDARVVPEALTSVRADDSAASTDVVLRLPHTLGVWSALLSSVSPTVFLPAGVRAAITSVCASVQRYAAWSATGVAAHARTHAHARILDALTRPRDEEVTVCGVQLSHLRAHAQILSHALATVDNAAAATPATDAALRAAPARSETPSRAGVNTDAASWADALVSPDLFLAAAGDARFLAHLVSHVIAARMCDHMGVRAGDAAHANVTTALSAGADVLVRIAPLHVATATAIYSRSVVNALTSSLRAVPSATRMSGAAGRALPRGHSPSITTVFKSIKTALSKGDHLREGTPDARSVVFGACSDASAAADDTLASVLDTIAHMDASLQWMKKSSDTGAADTALRAGVSDSDRIGLQLLLDVRGLASEMRELLRRTGGWPSSASGPVMDDAGLRELGGMFPSFDAALRRVATFEPLRVLGDV